MMKTFTGAIPKAIKAEVEHGPSKDIAEEHQDERKQTEKIERKVKEDCVDISHENKPQ